MPIPMALVFSAGISSLEIAAAREIFGVARTYLADPWYELVACVSETVRSCDACRIDRLCGPEQLVDAHTVIVPGWPDVTREPPADLVNALRDAHTAGARIVSADTGAFVLAAAGLLDGRRVTTHWAHADLLAARYPRVHVDLDTPYVDEGGVLTSAGGAATLDLFVHLVRCDHGAAVAKALAHHLVMPFQAADEQVPAAASPEPGPDDRVLTDVLSWAAERMDQQVTVEDMAQQANVSRRTLARHFRAGTGMAPLQWLLAQRVQLAQRLLETTHLSVEQIATQTGMGTAATLRRHFSRIVGVPPDSYRRWFRGRDRGREGPASLTWR
ncbi:AraC family transcriptional regulator [Streptomyces sp. CB02923]|uniref:GlxA family transcriptional regulator n=1 Tax=Streptomyces sp. CB02923 TaxID=1718985 RepID=UPI00093FB7A0|nr:helix-turn-helix domain-containing protein [Streptomyces sp. CB02923]OKI00956.1 AraC family transcriptional regulator [Streptomyces sp. CB02923]